MTFVHAEYIASEVWRQRREQYYETHSRRCASCGIKRKGKIDLHHLSYDNVFAEPDEDLMPLCRDCHGEIHEFHHIVGGSLRYATTLALPWTSRARHKRQKQAKHPEQRKGAVHKRRRRPTASVQGGE